MTAHRIIPLHSTLLAVPPLEPIDVLGIMVLVHADSSHCANSWKVGKPLSNEDYRRVYSSAFQGVLISLEVQHRRDRASSALWIVRDAPLQKLWDEFCVWFGSILMEAMRTESASNPRLFAIRAAIQDLKRTGALRVVEKGSPVDGVLNAASRKGRTHELGPEPARNLRDEDVIGTLAEDDAAESLRLVRTSDGELKLVPNYNRAFDRLVAALGERGEQEVPTGDTKDHDPRENPDAEVLDLVARVDLARQVRDLRDEIQRGGGALAAALEHLDNERPMTEVATEFGVTVDAIRYAKVRLEGLFRRFAG